MNWEQIIQLISAAILAGLIGIERETAGRAAGLRTFVVVGVGACLIMQIGTHLKMLYPETTMDPARLAAQVVSGLGFLGAGIIWKQKDVIRGLTTAASLWTVGGVGLAIGAGYVSGAIFVTGIVLLCLFLLSPVKRSLRNDRRKKASNRVGRRS